MFEQVVEQKAKVYNLQIRLSLEVTKSDQGRQDGDWYVKAF